MGPKDDRGLIGKEQWVPMGKSQLEWKNRIGREETTGTYQEETGALKRREANG